tara:strand:+ start:1537 stop:1896 length:360 start_codon:yes stop_codon:yes gene_type:complete
MSKFTEPEAAMLYAINAAGLEHPEHEYRFHTRRRWRFDFAYPGRLIAIEVEGLGRREPDGSWNPNGGGHQTRAGMTKDCEKYNEAALAGWTLIRVTAGMIKSGAAIEYVERALEVRGED